MKNLIRLVLLSLIVVGLSSPCRGNSNNCTVEFPAPETTGFVGYNYSLSGSTCEVTQRCSAALPQAALWPGRAWYLTDVKSQLGGTYNNDYIQLFNIQCPARTVLHLSLLNLDVDCGGDFIRVRAENFDEQVCGRLNDTDVLLSNLYNGGFGQIVGTNATVEFCTDSSITAGGFTLVATCLSPRDLLGTNCLDTRLAMRLYPGFVSIIDSGFPEPATVPAVHKRSAATGIRAYESEMKMTTRNKRFLTTRFERFQIGENSTVSYDFDPITRISTLVVNFGNGTTIEFDDVRYVSSFNDFIGTRLFFKSSPIIFEGEGEVEVFGNRGIVYYSVRDFNAIFLLDPDAARYARILHSYIYENWVSPFPILDEVNPNEFIFPFPDVEDADPFVYRTLSRLGFVREDVQEGSQCRRVFRPREAPAARTYVSKDAFRWCSFFFHTCDPVLKAACRDLLYVAP